MAQERSQEGQAKSLKTQGQTSPANIAHFLRGINFPASKDDLIQQAQQHNVDDKVLDVLGEMPERQYNDMSDVMKGVGEVE